MCCSPETCEVPIGRSTEANSVRDVTQIKRSSPFAEKRAACTYESVDKTAIITYGEQRRVSPVVNCGAVDCTDSIAISFTQTFSTSFSITTELGATILEVISASVSMSTTWTQETSTTVETAYEGSRPAGSSGYITFQPRLECTYDSFPGNEPD